MYREEEKIIVEEMMMKKKVEVCFRQKEEKFEKLRVKYQEVMKNEVVVVYKVVEEKRVMVVVKKGMDIFKIEEIVVKIRVIGKFFVKFGCFVV